MSKITIRTMVDRATGDDTMVDDTVAAVDGIAADRAAVDATELQVPGPEEEPPPGQRAKPRPVPRVKRVRRSLGLTQEEFAARYGIPLGTLRDWEQGRTEPDQPARAYIRVIASNPEWVSRALAAESQ